MTHHSKKSLTNAINQTIEQMKGKIRLPKKTGDATAVAFIMCYIFCKELLNSPKKQKWSLYGSVKSPEIANQIKKLRRQLDTPRSSHQTNPRKCEYLFDFTVWQEPNEIKPKLLLACESEMSTHHSVLTGKTKTPGFLAWDQEIYYLYDFSKLLFAPQSCAKLFIVRTSNKMKRTKKAFWNGEKEERHKKLIETFQKAIKTINPQETVVVVILPTTITDDITYGVLNAKTAEVTTILASEFFQTESSR